VVIKTTKSLAKTNAAVANNPPTSPAQNEHAIDQDSGLIAPSSQQLRLRPERKGKAKEPTPSVSEEEADDDELEDQLQVLSAQDETMREIDVIEAELEVDDGDG